MDDQLKKYIDKNKEAFDLKEPPAFMWENIKSTIPNLQTENTENEIYKVEKKQPKFKPLYFGVAASVLALVVTYFGFNSNSVNVINPNESVVKSNPAEKENHSESIFYDSILNQDKIESYVDSEIQSIVNDPIATNSINVVVDTLQVFKNKYANYLIQDSISASNRIKGIALLNNTKKISEEDLKMLRNVSLNDSNSIVRLNALEVLGKNLSKDKVTAELNSIFLEQDDAMVQLELINIIKSFDTGFEDPNLIKKLQEIILDSKSSPFLKDEAYVVLLEKNKL